MQRIDIGLESAYAQTVQSSYQMLLNRNPVTIRTETSSRDIFQISYPGGAHQAPGNKIEKRNSMPTLLCFLYFFSSLSLFLSSFSYFNMFLHIGPFLF